MRESTCASRIARSTLKTQAVEAEAARAERLSALEPVPAPDNIRYGGMTQAPLVRQLFAGLGASIAGGANGNTPGRVKAGMHTRSTIGNGMFVGGDEGQRGIEGQATGRGARGVVRGEDHARPGGRREEGRGLQTGGAGGSNWKQRRALTAASSANCERVSSTGARGDVREGFASALAHHRRNVIAVTVPPVQSVGAAGLVPETLLRGSGRGGSNDSGDGHGGDSDPNGA